jgi:hypothetical protein
MLDLDVAPSYLPVRNREKNVEVIACDKCRCTWLIPVKVNRYSTLQQALGVEPNSIHFEGPFILLQCAACGHIVFPPIESYRLGSPAFKLYEEMVEEIAGSREEAEHRRAGTSADRQTHGIWGHIPEKRKDPTG